MGLARTTGLRRRLVQICRAILIGLELFSLTSGVARAQVSMTLAHQKAIYIRNILSFVHWPQEPKDNREDDFQLCVDGDEALGFALSEEFRGITLNERKVVVRWARTEKEWKGCRALVTGALDERKIARLLASISRTDVLTLGETRGFLEAGGAVQLIQDRNGFQFEVNLEAARNAGVALDARLLSLARRVVNRPEIAGG